MEQLRDELNHSVFSLALRKKFGPMAGPLLRRLLDEDWDAPTPQTVEALRSVIASGTQHPDAQPYCEELSRLFHTQLFEPQLARDVDPAIRGPFGVAHIELRPNAVPQARRPFRTLGEREAALREIIEKFKERGWIRPSLSEWAAQAFVVPKPSKPGQPKAWRLVVDYRYLNSQSKDDPFPLPLIEALIGKQSANHIWSIFDLEDGFHQMHLDEESSHLTAFVTPWGVFEFTVLPMGVKNGPAMFQRMISWILRDVKCAVAYIDDVLVGTPRSISEPKLLQNHFKDCCEVLNTFKQHKITAKGAKVHLFMLMIKFCGHILSDGQRRAAPSKLQAIQEWQPEMITTITHLRGFLGLAQYYSQYVKNFAMISHPLTEQLKSRSPSNRKITWTPQMTEAFNAVKTALLENVVLDIADPTKPYILSTDASNYAVGGVLSQTDAEGNEHPVAFFSRKLKKKLDKNQINWSVREKETYAIVLCLMKFRSWLASTLVSIKVLTDHESLKTWYEEDLNRMVAAVGRRCRWHEFLSQFNLEVVYVSKALPTKWPIHFLAGHTQPMKVMLMPLSMVRPQPMPTLDAVKQLTIFMTTSQRKTLLALPHLSLYRM